MVTKTAPVPTPVAPPPDPAVEAIKAQAEADKLNAIQDRTAQRTTDLMLRFGARSALGARVTTPYSPAAGASQNPSDYLTPGFLQTGMDKLFNRANS